MDELMYEAKREALRLAREDENGHSTSETVLRRAQKYYEWLTGEEQ
jgi:hypothetical protein